MTNDAKNPSADASAFTLSRTFDARRDVVFKACSDPAELDRWWGPKGMNTTTSTMEFAPGGMFHYCMRTPNGQQMWGRFVYHEIAAPETIVFTSGFSDAEGKPQRAPFAAEFPLEILNVWAFSETDGRTTLTLRDTAHQATPAEEAYFVGMKDSMRQGFSSTFDQLDAHFANR